jgi:hypothetical protein
MKNKVINNIRKMQRLIFLKCLKEHYNMFYPFFAEVINNPDDDKYDSRLEVIAQMIWEKELLSGEYAVISWNKSVTLPDRDKITYATLSKRDNLIRFCGSDNGIELNITFDSIIGAINKDGATLLENKYNEYTVGKIDGKFVNSYNGATKLITPFQLVNLDQSCLYNELILDSRKIEVKGPITIIQEEESVYLR